MKKIFFIATLCLSTVCLGAEPGSSNNGPNATLCNLALSGNPVLTMAADHAFKMQEYFLAQAEYDAWKRTSGAFVFFPYISELANAHAKVALLEHQVIAAEETLARLGYYKQAEATKLEAQRGRALQQWVHQQKVQAEQNLRAIGILPEGGNYSMNRYMDGKDKDGKIKGLLANYKLQFWISKEWAVRN